MTEFLQATLGKLFEILKPEQICWLCLLMTIGGAMWAVNTFADADEVRVMRIEQLEQRAFDLRGQQCRAIGQGQLAGAYTTMLQAVLRSYKEVTGSDYRVPDCSELT